MFTLIKRYKLALLLILLAIGSFVAYQMLYVDGGITSLLVSQRGTEISGNVVGREIINLLDELQEISLSRDIFNDPAFRSLIDFEQDILPEPIGRSNPFAPIGVGNVFIGTSDDVLDI